MMIIGACEYPSGKGNLATCTVCALYVQVDRLVRRFRRQLNSIVWGSRRKEGREPAHSGKNRRLPGLKEESPPKEAAAWRHRGAPNLSNPSPQSTHVLYSANTASCSGFPPIVVKSALTFAEPLILTSYPMSIV